MYVILIVVDLAAGLLSGSVGCRRWSDSALLSVCGIGCAMTLGNFIAMRFIRNVSNSCNILLNTYILNAARTSCM